MGQQPTNGLDGRSLAPFLDGVDADWWRASAHWEFDFRGISKRHAETGLGLDSSLCNMAVIRDDAFKYVHFAGLPPLLFDLQKDPGEVENAVEHPDCLQIHVDFAERLLPWRAGHLDQTLAPSEVTEEGLAKAPYPM